MDQSSHPLLQAHILDLIRLKANENGAQVTDQQVKQVVTALIWMQTELVKMKGK